MKKVATQQEISKELQTIVQQLDEIELLIKNGPAIIIFQMKNP